MLTEDEILNSNNNPNPNVVEGQEEENDKPVTMNEEPEMGNDELGSVDDNPARSREFLAFVWETAKIIIISLAIILPIRYYLVQPFFVKGASMEPNFHDGDYLIIDEISYRFNEPDRGDVVVFRYPENPSQYFIKRIIALSGETIEIKNEQVKIYNSEYPEGFFLEENYLSPQQITDGDISDQIGEDEYFVLGDNRLQSSDSRRWGALPEKLITGRALLRLWPPNKITIVPEAVYISN